MAADELRQLKAEVLAATDIAQVIGDYVTLRRSGRSYVALCPFHEEKTPSFHVNPERGTWHCFGRCAKGGNAIDFVMAKEALEFWPALKLLAERAGVRLPERAGGGEGAGDERARCLRANELAQAFYRKALLESREAEGARAYVEQRGIDEGSAERFGLGYAPQSSGHLGRFLGRRGVSSADMVAAGLAGEREGGGSFERFRGRLTFPIRDGLGRVVGFGARALRAEDHPKYTNTPATAVFRKRELIYGLYEAKDALRARGEAAIVEGYLDVILGHQAGFPWLVATLGTAFGAAHASQLRRLVDRVTVVFDGDEAGLKANLRGLEEMAAFVLGGTKPFERIQVAPLPDGLDPADVVVGRGPQALGEVLGSARSLLDFLVPVESRHWPAERKVEAMRRAARVLSAFDVDAYREVQIPAVAHRLGVGEAVVRAEALAARRQRQSGQGRPGAAGPDGAAGTGGGADETPPPRMEVAALRWLLASPGLIERARAEVPLEWFEDTRTREIAATLYEGQGLAEIAHEEARALAARIAADMELGPAAADADRTWEGVALGLARRRCEHEAPLADDDASLRAFQEAMRRLKTVQATE